MATFYAPSTLEALMQSMPELRKKQRRAEQLRETQKKLEKQASDAQARGPKNYAPQQMGGLFPTVQQYQPDYGNAAEQGIGALGGYLMGGQAEGAQGEYDQAQSEAVLRAAQQMGGKPMDPTGAGVGLEAAEQQGTPANEAAMRAYMTMIGGPELAKALGEPNDLKARATQIDEDGNVWTQMTNGEWRQAGFKARSGVRSIVDPETGEIIQVSTTTQAPGARKVQMAGTSGGGGGAGGPLANLDREDLHARQMKQESGGNQNAVSKAGARGVMQIMPDTAAELAAQMGVPVEQIFSDAATNEKAGRLYMDQQLERYGGDQEAALIAYNAGPGNADKWLEAGRDYSVLPVREETEPYVRKILGQTGGGPSPTGTPAKVGGAQNVAFAKETGKAQAEAAAALGKAEGHADSGIRAVDDLLADEKGLRDIVGNKDEFLSYGRAPDALADYLVPLFSAGTDAARGYAKWKTVKGSAFLQAFEELRGGGQITEAEGKKAEIAKAALDRSQSYDDVKKALQDIREVMQAGLRRARARAKGDFSGDNALEVTMPAGMTSPSTAPALQPRQQAPVDDDIEALVNMYAPGG